MWPSLKSKLCNKQSSRNNIKLLLSNLLFLSSDSSSNEFIKLWLTVSILLRAESSHKLPVEELDNTISGRMYLVSLIQQIRYAIILVVLRGRMLKKYKKLFFKDDDPIEFILTS